MGLLDLRVSEDALDNFKYSLEYVVAKSFELSNRQGCSEGDSVSGLFNIDERG